jgi:hypothetical protein
VRTADEFVVGYLRASGDGISTSLAIVSLAISALAIGALAIIALTVYLVAKA